LGGGDKAESGPLHGVDVPKRRDTRKGHPPKNQSILPKRQRGGENH